MRRRSLLTGFVAILALASISFAGQIENPMFKTWTAYKPGTSITLQDIHRSAQGDRKTEIKYTLVSVAADVVELNVELTTERAGKKMVMPPHKQSVARVIDDKEDGAQGLKEIASAPTESVTVPAGTFKAKVWQHVINDDPSLSIKSKIWLSLDVPGGTVKTEMYNGKAGQEKLTSTIELAAIDKK